MAKLDQGRTLTAYTTYLVDPSGRVRMGETFDQPDDASAIAHFRGLEHHGEAAELWQSGRLVARLDVEGRFFLGSAG